MYSQPRRPAAKKRRHAKKAHIQGPESQSHNRTYQRGRYILLLGLTGSVGPLFSSPASPRSFHAGSLVVCTALAIPKAAATHHQPPSPRAAQSKPKERNRKHTMLVRNHVILILRIDGLVLRRDFNVYPKTQSVRHSNVTRV